jgi:hypothetical protein
MNYKIYFQIYGKKMQCEVFAESTSEAINKVRSELTIDKIVPEINNTFRENSAMPDILKDIFGGFKG